MDDPLNITGPYNPGINRGRGASTGRYPNARGNANTPRRPQLFLRQDDGHYNPGINRGRGASTGRYPNARGNANTPSRPQLFLRQDDEMQNDGRLAERRQQTARSRSQSYRGNRNQNPNNGENNHSHGNRSDQNNHQRRNFPRKQFLGFRRLEEIAKSETKETLTKLMECRNAFIELIQSPIEKFDIFVVIMEIMAKVCQSSFDETKSLLLLDICNCNFIVSFKSYLMDLPYPESKMSNNLYWKDQEAFWKNFINFCECIVNTSPTLALNKCRSLLEATSIACLTGLKDRHGFELSKECSDKMAELKERMVTFEKSNEQEKRPSRFTTEEEAPPEDFRELSIMPTREDLLQIKPYIRPNIINGSYQDVEHYLDVQFRLLREDCFGPLRVGLNQFLHDLTRKRYDHIRVFRNVKFLKPYVSQTKVGSMVQLDVKNNKMFKKTNWANNKRFIFGSLVLFTKDNIQTFIAATILDREEDFLIRGMIPVGIIGQGFNVNLYNDDTYTMIESEVYFEPYYHVLKVLQDPTFPQNLAMRQYIVDVNPQPRPPSYLNATTEFIVGTVDSKLEMTKKFTVLQFETWPEKDALYFNDSQYDAYRLSLTHEFAVVQGPPGTGKTFLGIKVAKTLFENLKETDGCLMLVICYTNHALDQFLEALMEITSSIVRIGGQSRNESMEKINLQKLRRNENIQSRAFFEQKMTLKDVICDFQQSLVRFDVLLNGVVKSEMIADDVEGVRCLRKYYKEVGLDRSLDPLFHWLFEDNRQYYTYDINHLFEDNADENDFAKLEKENRKRTGVVLDEQDIINSEIMAYRKQISSFSVEAATAQIKKLVIQFRKTEDLRQRQDIAHELQFLDSCRTMYNEMTTHRMRQINIRIAENTNFSRIETIDRWSLYFSWIRKQTVKARKEVGEMQEKVNTATAVYEESRMMTDVQLLMNKRIVGMTTSGAARMRKLLQALNPPIVIVEEAAEVLEQHIITSLTGGCKHLILIGDHQQLRPSASHMKLAKHFQLEVSLFERMISNGIHSRRLSVQHRMRPEIAALICPHIYPELENHPSVYEFPDVMGMVKNMFFYSHEFHEEEVEENMSRTNHREADMTLGLANYLMQQGYVAEDVTILAAYKGQMFYMRKESDKYAHLNGVKITVVDNYQGEESKIILLSLVRNNDENKIGFLGIPNRICVALSRAKHGFYMFGNIETLKANSELWKNIAATLETRNSLGTSLTLQCQTHNDNITIIEKLEDFQKVPEGGCLLPCNMNLPKCGHKCLLMCHGYDRNHVTGATKCTRKCERIQCEFMHVCPKKCAEDCGPCKKKMPKQLPCGHEVELYCYLDPEDPSVKCHTMVEVTLPDCEHQATKECYVDVKNVRCEVNCEFRVEKCGHSCLRKCHVKDDPDHEKYICMKQCAKAKLNCTADLEGDRGDHQCNKKCHETCDSCNVLVMKSRTACKHSLKIKCSTDPDSEPCRKKCSRSLPCGHFCKKSCKETCGDCRVMVTKTIPDCKHKVKMQCKIEPSREHCDKNCELVMSCGHKCKGLCGRECRPSECSEPSLRKCNSPCGHLISLPCNMAELPAADLKPEVLLSVCREPCNVELACKHVCKGTCASCHQARLHVPCTQTCNQNNICGHQCVEPCNQICPPCKEKCIVKCQHNRCGQECGAPCKPCKEKCGRRCKHGACKNRCGEACSRPACNESCPLLLKCKHACRGLCGEICPPICKTCHPDTFPVDFLGYPFEDTDRFILLQDCGHAMEVESMDRIMMGDTETVQIRCCPSCRKPIINTGRYKHLVNATLNNEINTIKERVYGTANKIKATRHKLHVDLGSYQEKYSMVLNENNQLQHVFRSLESIVKTGKKVTKLQLDMGLVCLDILDMISECCKTYWTSKATELKLELLNQVKLICKIFVFNNKQGMFKISLQQRADVKLEIRRLNVIVQFAKLLSHDAYAALKNIPAVWAAFGEANAAVFKPDAFKIDEAIDALKKLQEAIKVSGVVSKQERDLIVRAIGLKAGHWFKCPNGHYYCIGECGGAMQVGKCVECGVGVGGSNHNLLNGNRHAPEVDGSPFPAWSQEYNNMANFDINN